MQLKKIKVYGKLRRFLGKSYFEAAVKSPQQAICFLVANFEGLQKHMNDQIYKVKMNGRVITEDALTISGQGDIQIIPVATGSVPIVIGVAALGASAAIPAAVLGSTFLATALTTTLTAVGTSMLIGGITEMIAPSPQLPQLSEVSQNDPSIRGSYTFSGIQNVSSSGVPVPIIYGSVFCGSIVISSGTDSAQVVKTVS
jgi:predicted phage tail protein